ncbi:MAG: hypothetical protein ABSD20_07945 [Terriglobales bacterium]|jgi:hypothetical protein
MTINKTDFKAALAALTRAEVRFVIIGGFALNLLGGTRVTFDLDICYERSSENLKRLAEALSPYHPRLRGVDAVVPFILDVETLKRGLNFTITTDVGDIDLLGELQGVGYFEEVARECEMQELYDITCAVASHDVLLRNKRTAARSKDLQDVQELDALLEIKRRRQEETRTPDTPDSKLTTQD